jgi:tetratricopeptide (TPR) repeat protein
MRTVIPTLVRSAVSGLCAVLAMGFALGAAAQEPDTSADEPIPLYETLGDYSRTITTDSDLAQAYFNQGLRLAYGFGRMDAAHSFRAAQLHDPDCAMCYWGEAWMLGPYQNNPAGVGSLERAHDASREALDRIEGTRSWEAALIRAMADRYPPPANGGEATGPGRVEVNAYAYADAMAEAARAHPDDLDVRVVYAESLMALRPWDLWEDAHHPHEETVEVVKELEAVLARDMGHAGACHLYIHAVEESAEPRRAEACADLLAEAIPGASHVQHMPSHIYMRIGRYGDAVRANQQARIVDQRAELGETFAVYPPHNTGMLVFATWMDGQSGVALSAARDMGRENPDDRFQYHLLLARFGHWDRLLEVDSRLGDPFQDALVDFARGLALLRTGDARGAQAALEQVRTVRDATPEDAAYGFFQHPQRDLLGVAEGILAGELAGSRGSVGEAEEHLREAIRLEDGLPYSEPEPWPIPARHVLGAILLEADRPERAEAVYRESLEVHPANGWSLKGLSLSLAAQGREFEAAQVEREFQEVWKRADVWITGSRF